jgi:hypothetical protein
MPLRASGSKKLPLSNILDLVSRGFATPASSPGRYGFQISGNGFCVRSQTPIYSFAAGIINNKSAHSSCFLAAYRGIDNLFSLGPAN